MLHLQRTVKLGGIYFFVTGSALAFLLSIHIPDSTAPVSPISFPLTRSYLLYFELIPICLVLSLIHFLSSHCGKTNVSLWHVAIVSKLLLNVCRRQ